jgi:polyisoprenoid-binding protein YceI
MQQAPIDYTICPSNESTVAVEVFKTGLTRRKKHTVFFEKFSGTMHFASQDPAACRVILTIDATSVACRDASLSKKKRRAIEDFVHEDVLGAHVFPEIQFTSTRVSAKALRGFLVEGVLKIRDTTANVKANLVLNPMTNGQLQMDSDALLRLSDFGLPRPSAMFGLVGTAENAVAHLLLWAVPRV